MKIVITGGGSGGHFYPLIAVADKVRELSDDKKIIQPKIFYMAVEPYNEDILFQQDIEFVKINAGKLSLDPSFKSIIEIIKTGWGVFTSFLKIFKIFPDVIFTNGGYVAFPVLVAAKILRIPVVIHASDTVPSRVLLFAGKFAEKISIAFPEAAKFFPKDKVALLGNPVRDGVKYKQKEGSHDYFNLDPSIPVILIIGGSQGSQIINETVLDSLPELVKKYQIIHQVGKNNYDELYGTTGVVLMNNKFKSRYKIFPYLSDLQMKMAAGITDLVVSRSGAGSIAEISNWELPSILIPLSKIISRDQESNSFAYSRTGSAQIIRQKNLSPNILTYEINRLFDDKVLLKKMKESAKKSFLPDAEVKIAKEILKILISHQK